MPYAKSTVAPAPRLTARTLAKAQSKTTKTVVGANDNGESTVTSWLQQATTSSRSDQVDDDEDDTMEDQQQDWPAYQQDIVKALLPTIPRYNDGRSRLAVLAVVESLLTRPLTSQLDNGSAQSSGESRPTQSIDLLVGLIKWLEAESIKLERSASSSTRFAVLLWACTIYSSAAATVKQDANLLTDAQWSSLCQSLAALVYVLLDQREPVKPALRKSVLTTTRRAVRTNHAQIPRLVDALVASKTDPLFRGAPLLGLSMDVALRLKDPKGQRGVGQGYVDALKGKVMSYYVSNVTTAKTLPPRHVQTAFADLFRLSSTQEELQSIIVPALEKAVTRSTEVGLSLFESFLSCINPDMALSSEAKTKVLNSILNASKSVNASTRAISVQLFEAVFARTSSEETMRAVEQMASLFKSGKTASPDHRTTLYTMLLSLAPSASVSTEIVNLVLGLLPKEANEHTFAAMMRLLSIHMPEFLKSGKNVEAAQSAAIVKAMQDTKATNRRNAHCAVADILWSIDGPSSEIVSEAVRAFVVALLPGLESALKTVTTNPLNAPAGPLEGFAAVAVLKARLATWNIKHVDALISSNSTMQNLYTAGAKPSFLLWDKVYRKCTSVEEEKWVLRALEAVFVADKTKFEADAVVRNSFAHAMLHFVTESANKDTRQAVIDIVRRNTLASPQLVYSTFLEGMSSWLGQLEKAKQAVKPSSAAAIASEDADTPEDRTPRIRQILLAMASFSDEVSIDVKEALLTQAMVLAHHPRLETSAWVEMLLNAQVPPERLIESKTTDLFELVQQNASSVPTSKSFAEAAYRSVTTMALISPRVVVPLVFVQLKDDLDPERLGFIGSTEYGIWGTPEGVTFVDVLTSAKPKAPVGKKNSKEHETAVWEAELREALARKKPVASQMSKQERQAFESQLEKEGQVRQKMGDALGRLRRGFAFVLCLVDSKAELVKEYLASIVQLLLQVVVKQPASLVAEDAFATIQALGDVCSERLGFSKIALGVAVLRSVDAPIVPENFQSEPLPALVTRILFRLRFLAEQEPFDAGTFAYAAPLVSKVLRNGGVGVEKSDTEGALEQLTLALDFIGFHARHCSETAFPRVEMIKDLLACLVGYPALGRTATTALADVCEAIKLNASSDEIAAVLDGAMTEETAVRFACVQALQSLDLTDLEYPARLWIAAHDEDERNRELAATAWVENALDVPSTYLVPLLPFLGHSSAAIRQATAEAVAEAVGVHPDTVGETLLKVVVEYQEKAKELLPQYDQFGMIIEASLTAEDPWRNRKALATTLRLIAQHFGPTHVTSFFDLLIERQALGDRSQAVRSEMLEAGIVVIDLHGKENLQSLNDKFEEYLARPSTGETQDFIVESLVILFGRLARHLDPSDTRVKSVIERLIEALKTPSEVVQSAVCECLPPLVVTMKDEVPSIVDRLMNDMFLAPKYAERRGAAYGLAGVVRGRGLSSLREFGIMGRLRDNAEDKKDVNARQGAIFGYEILSTVLGRLFEPYVTEILPLLLACYGDTAREVREATQDAAKAIMSKLSGHAVKLILPTLLEGLEERQWRAKKGAIDMMGSMAFLAPRQLAASLPTILPRLTEVLTDTHKQVRESANASLARFGEVVTNPEIQEMTQTLLDALVDPARKTAKALETLLSTTFAHFIDASSLALIVPILDRGLRERSADVKRKSAAIVGNMATLTEAKDLAPYLGQVVPLLRSVLIDPVPEARSTAAKSLGALVERLGENNFPDLIDSLMSVLKSQTSGVDQQGAAQGLAEVLQACGIDRLEGVLPMIITNTSSPRTYVREGHINLLVFLPVTFGERFSPYLGRIIQPVLNGLADDSDFVREASMRAGRMIVANHSTKAIDLLLPELERGLFDESWRIRQSSVQLAGDLLFRISGISGKMTDEDEVEEDQNEEIEIGTDAARKALIDTLGKERRDRVLSALYIVRQDSIGAVRQAALQVWKALVGNTPRTVRDILPVLMQVIVRILASPGLDQRETAARTLADTSRKLGETVLGEIVSILAKAMSSSDRRQREGVCLALTEIMANATKSSLETHEGAIIDVVRTALVDSEPTVRSAAAQAFDIAQQVIGARSIDETIPTLLDALQQPGDTADAALAALQEVMQVRAEKIFPVLIPRLIAPPITAFNARALAALVRVAGSALGKRLTSIVDALQAALTSEKDESTLQDLDSALTAVLASVSGHESGLGNLLLHVLSLAKNESWAKRVVGCNLFQRFCEATQADFSDFTIDWVRQLVSLFDDRVPEVVGAAWSAMDALSKKVSKEEMEPLVVPLRRTIESTGTPGVPVDGFSRPNGLKPLLPILLQGLLAGTGEQREQAAYGLGDLVERTDPLAFKPYTIQVVGPLIRVIGDRFPAPVKSAILSTLTTLLTRVPLFVKPFFPQLQRTFVKSLVDPTSLSVRMKASAALRVLMEHQPRVDPVVVELVNLTSTEQGEVRESVVQGLANVIISGGGNLGEAAKSSCVDLVSETFSETNKESYENSVARVVAALALHDPSSVSFVVDSFLFGDLPPTHLSSATMREIIDVAPKVLYDLHKVETVARVVKFAAGGNTVPPSIARPARDAKELLKERVPWADDDEVQSRLQ
ncbi:translational activator of GCN4 [Microbotryomycetes sp. JL221]|nr:translational activator of GCN4 [Microbotryomycetes sp. JL221]